MKTKIIGAVAALALIGGSAMALADAGHPHRGPHGAAATDAQSARPDGHGGQHMAEMRARMSERHGATNPGRPRDGSQRHGHGHDHGQAASPAPVPAK